MCWMDILYYILQVLLINNAKVYLAARSLSKAQATIEELKASTGKEAIFLDLDLESLAGVKKSAETFLRYVIGPHKTPTADVGLLL